MKNKKLLAVLAVTISASVFMAGCGFGEDEPEAQKVVSVTPAPEVTKAPTATPTIAPNVQDTTYTSADKSVSINLPDATWANKTDETDTISFESPDNGNILILHGQGEETMAATVIPSTQDMAVSLDQADGDKVQGTDFEIQDYKAEDVNGIGVYSYVTKMLNTEKSDGALYVVHKVFANASEYYSIEASVKKEEALASVKSAVDSFKILGNSSLKEAAPGTVPPAGNTENKTRQAQTQQETMRQQIQETLMQVQQIQELLIQALIPRKAESLLLKEQQILQALQKNSFPIQMKQELFTETLTVSRW